MVHVFCLPQLCGCTLVHPGHPVHLCYTYWRQHGLSKGFVSKLFLPNETSNITCMNRFDQSQMCDGNKEGNQLPLLIIDNNISAIWLENGLPRQNSMVQGLCLLMLKVIYFRGGLINTLRTNNWCNFFTDTRPFLGIYV